MAPKPQIEPYIKYPKSLETLGDHIRKRRLDLKLTAREVGNRMGVAMATVYKWEYHVENPHPRLFADIVRFLGYEPDVFVRRYLGERILAYRKLHGISQTQLALMVGVHRTTLGQWERNERRPSKEFFEKLSLVLEGTCSNEKKRDR